MRVIICSILLTLSFNAYVLGQPLPALHQVSADAGIVILRAEPNPGSYELAEILPGTVVEVVAMSDDGLWAVTNADGASGYIPMTVLLEPRYQEDRDLPLPLNCSGTEPFWNLSVAADGSSVFSNPEEDAVSLSLDWSGNAVMRPGEVLGLRVVSEGREITGVIRRETCSDGMSDLAYGFSIHLISTEHDGSYMIGGCCSIQP